MTSPIDERKVRKFDWDVCKNSEPPHLKARSSEKADPSSFRKRVSRVLALWLLVVTVAFIWMSISPLLQDSYIRRDPAWTVAAP